MDLEGTVSSAVFDLRANGLVDLGESRFEDLRVALLLKQPATVAPNLSGRDVRATLVLDGAYATPVVDYRVRAAAIGFNDTVVQGLEASGVARIGSDRILLPVSARARAITGLNATAGELLTNVSINGDLAIEGPPRPVGQPEDPLRPAERHRHRGRGHVDRPLHRRDQRLAQRLPRRECRHLQPEHGRRPAPVARRLRAGRARAGALHPAC